MTQERRDSRHGESHGGADLEARLRAGDPAAAAEVVERSRDALVRFAYRYLGNIHEAEDVVQDALAALLAGDSRPADSPRAWLFGAVRYRCLDHKKRRKSGHLGRGTLFGDVHPSPRTGPPTAAVREEEHEALRRHLAALPTERAEPLVLRYFEGMSRREIAEVLDVPESVVKSRLYDGSRELRRRLGEEP